MQAVMDRSQPEAAAARQVMPVATVAPAVPEAHPLTDTNAH
jgi:hypothetical protein